VWTKTSTDYGSRKKIEIWEMKEHNIHKNPELMALPRHLPKGWKKPKWKPRFDEKK